MKRKQKEPTATTEKTRTEREKKNNAGRGKGEKAGTRKKAQRWGGLRDGGEQKKYRREESTGRSICAASIDHFIVTKEGVYTHYMSPWHYGRRVARVCTHSGDRATQNVRCLVSINIGSTGWLLQQRGRPLVSLFYGAICLPLCASAPPGARAAEPAAHLSARNLPVLRFDGQQSKHMDHPTRYLWLLHGHTEPRAPSR